MLIEFDSAKDRANQVKHGLSLAFANELDWDSALVWVDVRRDYGEIRMVALAPQTGILYFVAFIDRAHSRRIIGLRRANRREVKRYAQSPWSPCGGHAHAGRGQTDHCSGQGRL